LPLSTSTNATTPMDPTGEEWLEEIRAQLNTIHNPLCPSGSTRIPKSQLTEATLKLDLATTILIRGIFNSRSQVVTKMQSLEARERQVKNTKAELEQRRKQLAANVEELKAIQTGVAEMSRMAKFEQQSVNGQQERIWLRDREFRRKEADHLAEVTEKKTASLKMKSQKAEIRWLEVRLKGRQDTLRRKSEMVAASRELLKEKEALLIEYRDHMVEYKSALQGRYTEREEVYREYLTDTQLEEVDKRFADAGGE
jgi:hypothetical protein